MQGEREGGWEGEGEGSAGGGNLLLAQLLVANKMLQKSWWKEVIACRRFGERKWRWEVEVMGVGLEVKGRRVGG